MISINAILVKQLNQLLAGEKGRGKLFPWEGTSLQLGLENDYIASIQFWSTIKGERTKGAVEQGRANHSPGIKSLQLDLEKGKFQISKNYPTRNTNQI